MKYIDPPKPVKAKLFQISLIVCIIWLGAIAVFGDGRDTVGGVLAVKIYCSIVMLIIIIWIGVIHARISHLFARQNWFIDATNANITRLNKQALPSMSENKNGEEVQPLESQSRWPWGNHHTEYLGHLEAAAKKLWVLYDPLDFTTAPTNEVVSEWLQSERGVSREKARAIASMLRPDGLPTGPRR